MTDFVLNEKHSVRFSNHNQSCLIPNIQGCQVELLPQIQIIHPKLLHPINLRQIITKLHNRKLQLHIRLIKYHIPSHIPLRIQQSRHRRVRPYRIRHNLTRLPILQAIEIHHLHIIILTIHRHPTCIIKLEILTIIRIPRPYRYHIRTLCTIPRYPSRREL